MAKHPIRLLSTDEFELLVKLRRQKVGPRRDVCEAVLVRGVAVAVAAALAGLSYKRAHAACQLARKFVVEMGLFTQPGESK